MLYYNVFRVPLRCFKMFYTRKFRHELFSSRSQWKQEGTCENVQEMLVKCRQDVGTPKLCDCIPLLATTDSKRRFLNVKCQDEGDA